MSAMLSRGGRERLRAVQDSCREHLSALIRLEDEACAVLGIGESSAEQNERDCVIDFSGGHKTINELVRSVRTSQARRLS